MKLLISFLIISSALASDNYLKMMAYDHENMGCPANSLCTREMGIKAFKWRKLLESYYKNGKLDPIQKFVKSNGLFIEHYTKISKTTWPKIDGNKPVLWDSTCEHHRKNSISVGKSFIMNSAKQDKDIQLDPIHIQRGKKVQTFYLPKELRPNYLDNTSAYFIHEEEGHYLTIKISKDGQYSVVPRNEKAMKQIAESMTREAKCTEILTNTKLKAEKAFYQAHYCRLTWNISTNSYQVVMAPLACY